MVMDDREFRLHDGKKGAALAIRITPRAKQNKVVDILSDGTIKIHLKTDPSDPNINELLLIFLSKELNVSKNRLEIVGGTTGRDKLVSILDMKAEDLHKEIQGLIKGD